MLTIAMAELTGYSGDGHVKLAAAVEFMHTATLLHDDVVDESEMRRGKLAARMLWGNEASVLVGDFLLGQAFRMMVEVGNLRALEILSSAAAVVIAEGEVMQLAAAKNTATTEDEYLAVIRGKTAELFAAACEVGPVLAGRAKDRSRRLPFVRNESRHRVPARRRRARLRRQVRQARQECRRRFPRRQDHAAGGAVVPARQCRGALVLDAAIEQGETTRRRSRICHCADDQHRALEDTIKRAQHYGAMAKDALALFPLSDVKQALEETVDFCIARAH